MENNKWKYMNETSFGFDGKPDKMNFNTSMTHRMSKKNLRYKLSNIDKTTIMLIYRTQ